MTKHFDQDESSPANDKSGRETGGTQGSAEHYKLPVPLVGSQAIEEEAAPDPYERFLNRIQDTLPGDYVVDIERKVIVSPAANAVVCGLICPVLHVRDPQSGSDWAICIQFLDHDGALQTETFEDNDVFGKGRYLQELRRHGLYVGFFPKLLTRLIHEWIWQSPIPKGWRVDRTGWLTLPGEEQIYIQPDGSVSSGRDGTHQQLVLRNARRVEVNGTLRQWSEEVAAYAVGNRILMFVIAAALAGPFLKSADLQTAAFNLFGRSSSGKTLLMQAATSCWGHPASARKWSDAVPRLPTLRRLHNDGSMSFDGFPVSPTAKDLRTFASIEEDSHYADADTHHRNVFLITAEATTATMFQRHRKLCSEAFEARVCNIPVDRELHGAFGELHGHDEPDGLIAALHSAMASHHGHAGPSLVQWMLLNPRTAEDRFSYHVERFMRRELRSRGEGMLDGMGFQRLRRLAVVAAAGETAIVAGVLPWPRNSCARAVHEIASFWHAAATETEFGQPLHRLRDFLARHDLPWRGGDPIPEEQPVGFQDDEHFYIKSEIFREEITADRGHLDALDQAGVVNRGTEKDLFQYRTGATEWRGRPRVYRISKDRLAACSPMVEDECPPQEDVIRLFPFFDDEDDEPGRRESDNLRPSLR